MHRIALDRLKAWKGSPRRRPLVVLGPRLVGKTTLVDGFGAKAFKRQARISFSKSLPMAKVFQGSLEAPRLVDAISAATGEPIDPETLIVLDDVQECPRAIQALRSFREQRPELAVVAIASFSEDVLLRQPDFPAGKVDYLSVHPLTFSEFLRATGRRPLANLLDAGDFDAMDAAAPRFTDALRQYLFVGGMPAAVAAWVQTRDWAKVRAAQDRLLDECDLYFVRQMRGVQADRVRQVWRSIPQQLIGDNKKFRYNAVGKGGRSRTHQGAVSWLVDAGLVMRVNRIDRPGIPLANHVDEKAFRLFPLDVGLLAAALEVPQSTLVGGDAIFEYGNGALAQQYVCQQLVTSGQVVPRYWSAERSGGEVDFVYGHRNQVVPVEVSARVNRRAKSLRAFADRYGLNHALRLSLDPYREGDWVTDIPLYAAPALPLL